jgi:ABC-type lipoprotein release transport system permease subunit
MTLLQRLAWRNIWRQKRRTLITAVAMAGGLAFCLGMVALVEGTYQQMFDQIVTRSVGHVQIHHPDYPSKRAIYETIPEAETLLGELDALPQVQQATARAFGYCLLGSERETLGAQLLGIDPAREAAVTELDRWVVEGDYLRPDQPGRLLLGFELAERLSAGVGDELVAVTQAADGSLGNELYTVAGVVNTGNTAQDRGGAFLLTADLQALLALPDQVHEIALLTTDRDAVAALVAEAGPVAEDRGLLLRSWTEVNPQLSQMLEMGDASTLILLTIIYAVAALGILNTMLMSVFERTRELGVMVAVGLRPLQVVRLVLWETLWLAGVATAIGLPLGLALVAYLVFHGLDLSAVVGEMSTMGARWDPVMRGAFGLQGLLTTVLGLFFVSMLAAVWPALRAARLQPVVAMRQE